VCHYPQILGNSHAFKAYTQTSDSKEALQALVSVEHSILHKFLLVRGTANTEKKLLSVTMVYVLADTHRFMTVVLRFETCLCY
jgi:hypothetical protein